MIKGLLLIIITLFIPPLGVFLVAGCGMDLLINILLTLLGYLPGHIHAFYIEYIYFKRRNEARAGIVSPARAPGVYSQKVQNGGMRRGATAVGAVPAAPYGGQQVGGGEYVQSGFITPVQQGYPAGQRG